MGSTWLLMGLNMYCLSSAILLDAQNVLTQQSKNKAKLHVLFACNYFIYSREIRTFLAREHMKTSVPGRGQYPTSLLCT